MAVLVLGAIAVSRRLAHEPSATQEVCELVVDTVDSQIRDTMQAEPGPYRAFIGTLFVFIFAANWSTLIPASNRRPRIWKPTRLWRCWCSSR